MRLSDAERKVLSVIELRANDSYDEIGKACRIRSHAARYAIARLEEKGVLGPKRPIIDMNRLGFVHYTLFFNLSNASQRQHRHFLERVSSSREVSWLFELGGDYQYGLSISARSIHAAIRYLESLSHDFDRLFFEKNLTIQHSMTYFGRRYLNPSGSHPKPLSFVLTEDHLDIDATDGKILMDLAHHDLTPLAQTCARLKLTTATLERRKRALQEKGVIRGYFRWIEPASLGRQCYVLLIQHRGFGGAMLPMLLEFAQRELQVTYVINCLGSWGFEVGIEAQHPRNVIEITQKIASLRPEDITTIKVVPILNYLKWKSCSL